MEEHIFGTFSTDRLKLLHERVSALGVQHRARIIPPDPAPDEPFKLVVTTGPDVAIDDLAVCYTLDGGEPTLECNRLSFEIAGRSWNTSTWGYVTEWHATVPGQPEGTLLRYRIAVRLTDGDWHWADWPRPKRAVEDALVNGEVEEIRAKPARASDFAVSIDRFAPPDWAEEAVVYQLFLDRFAQDEDRPWPVLPSLFDVHGGTLRGAAHKLDHIASLGATCIWLSPIFPTPTHHGYDATDYYSIEPRLGTEEDLRAFVDGAHARGIRVLLDFVANHFSNKHPIFQKALADPKSPERGWFWIDPAIKPHGYRTFFNDASMPELNTDHPEVQAYLIGAAERWVRDFDVDGYRLDYAHGPSHGFWTTFWRSLKQLKRDVWCFGEVVDIPTSQRQYIGRLDGVLDFHTGDALRRVFAHGTSDMVWLDAFLRDHDTYFPPQIQFTRPSFLDNHDMDRFLHVAGGSVRKLRLASLLLYSLPNPPILYYGTEVGLPQRFGRDMGHGLEVSREPMQWGRTKSHSELVDYFRRLSRLRREIPAMRPLERERLYLSPDQYLGRHRRDRSELLLALNRSEKPVTLHHDALHGAFEEPLRGSRLSLEGTLRLDGFEGRLLLPSWSG